MAVETYWEEIERNMELSESERTRELVKNKIDELISEWYEVNGARYSRVINGKNVIEKLVYDNNNWQRCTMVL